MKCCKQMEIEMSWFWFVCGLENNHKLLRNGLLHNRQDLAMKFVPNLMTAVHFLAEGVLMALCLSLPFQPLIGLCEYSTLLRTLYSYFSCCLNEMQRVLQTDNYLQICFEVWAFLLMQVFYCQVFFFCSHSLCFSTDNLQLSQSL